MKDDNTLNQTISPATIIQLFDCACDSETDSLYSRVFSYIISISSNSYRHSFPIFTLASKSLELETAAIGKLEKVNSP